VTALGTLETMTVHVGPYEFGRVSYDDDGDVLYLRTRSERPATDTFTSPEGHAVRLDEHGEILGITIVNAKWLLERDGGLSVTVPSLMEADPGDLARVLASA
jgi:uncharacterized protein YuzE